MEAEWNSKLHALSEAERNYERQCQADQLKIGTVQREQVLALATNFPQLWNDPSTADRERKRMVRLLIEDVTIRKGEQVQLDVRFRGGMATTLKLPRPLSYCESHKQNPAMVAEMDRLLDHYNYADVARILNEKGFKTGDGLPLTSTAVGYVRKAYGLKSRFDRLRERGMLTMFEMARRCDVSVISFVCRQTPYSRVGKSVRFGATVGALRGAYTGFTAGEALGGAVSFGSSGLAGAGIGALIGGTQGALGGLSTAPVWIGGCKAAGAY